MNICKNYTNDDLEREKGMDKEIEKEVLNKGKESICVGCKYDKDCNYQIFESNTTECLHKEVIIPTMEKEVV